MLTNGHKPNGLYPEYVSRAEFLDFQLQVRRALTALVELTILSEVQEAAAKQRAHPREQRTEEPELPAWLEGSGLDGPDLSDQDPPVRER